MAVFIIVLFFLFFFFFFVEIYLVKNSNTADSYVHTQYHVPYNFVLEQELFVLLMDFNKDEDKSYQHYLERHLPF